MKTKLSLALLWLGATAIAQQNNPSSPLDALSYGVVLEHPGMKNVVVKPDIVYLNDAKGGLHLEKAIQYGYDARNQFESDPDLESLKPDARFKAILEKTK